MYSRAAPRSKRRRQVHRRQKKGSGGGGGSDETGGGGEEEGGKEIRIETSTNRSSVKDFGVLGEKGRGTEKEGEGFVEPRGS
ncbi:hypothetical protein KM043_002710 [Ampulex compressa]|nr:hypothetical protein KM043_002710 [Ampulex compressa]